MAVLTLSELITDRLNPMLGYIQHVEMHEILCKHISATTVQAPYGNWNATPAPIYRRNGTIFTPDSVDTDTGIITISDLVSGEDIHVSAEFSYFTTEDLTSFFQLSLQRFNNAPPKSNYVFNSSGVDANYPQDAEFFLVNHSYKLAIDALMVDLLGWRAGIIWRDPNGLASFLQSKSNQIEQYLSAIYLTVKGRANLSPRSVSVGRFKMPSLVTGENFRSFLPIRS